jgi:hypothetical protein
MRALIVSACMGLYEKIGGVYEVLISFVKAFIGRIGDFSEEQRIGLKKDFLFLRNISIQQKKGQSFMT